MARRPLGEGRPVLAAGGGPCSHTGRGHSDTDDARAHTHRWVRVHLGRPAEISGMNQRPAGGNVLRFRRMRTGVTSTGHGYIICSAAHESANVPKHVKQRKAWGAWVAQSVERPTSAQVMISRSMGLSPASGSLLTAQSLEPASDSVSPSLSAPPLLVLSLSLKKNKIK